MIDVDKLRDDLATGPLGHSAARFGAECENGRPVFLITLSAARQITVAYADGGIATLDIGGADPVGAMRVVAMIAGGFGCFDGTPTIH